MTRRYGNLDPADGPHTAASIFRWGVLDRLLGRRRIAPPGPAAPRVPPRLDLIHDPEGPPRVTWIGHASFLITLGDSSFLVDPVFADHAGWIYRRFTAPGLSIGDLPRIEAVLITHSHYDHLDESFIRRLARDMPVFCPAGLARWFVRRGLTRVTELRWWDVAACGECSIRFVPARHWSRRRIGDTNHSWWGGFVIERNGVAVYHAGDTGWFEGFGLIRQRVPAITAALLPVGAYSPAWFMEPNHMNPEQAGRAFLELGARELVPMHWGTFQLTDEPLCEPVERVRRWWSQHVPADGRRLRVAAVGETIDI